MKKTKMKAFTLVEMAIVIFIISLLILIIIPNVAKQRSNAENVNTQALQAELDTQAQLYADEKGNGDGKCCSNRSRKSWIFDS